jgi:hypothetical protein
MNYSGGEAISHRKEAGDKWSELRDDTQRGKPKKYLKTAS